MDYKSLRKWSELHNTAVVTMNDGKKVGTIDDFYFDPQTNSLPGFRIKTGLIGHKALKSSAITAFGQDAITAATEDALISEKDDAQLSSVSTGSGLLSYRVMSESGKVIGTIGNVLLDLNTPGTASVAAFELASNLLQRIGGNHMIFEASQVTRYGQDVIVVPDAVALDLSQ